ncbi:hypothetical protein LX16_1887 [Stackebrandtia albiflava]|uniref:Uncharacterized protein n=1 Tax=Stackebrandtia albiflava TaxID=406432 RepID=A0A562VE54_9ACTN|nr:hypothetical protein [Stackebrandtia albiflava]TWJ16163.1 hypothetical protein LX16_1887 [Stackebrandtia albiflava]
MPKQLNPMPPSAKTARRAIWVQVLLALALGGAIWFGHENRHEWIPDVVADDIYRTAAGLAAGAVFLLLMSWLMRYQWRWVWVLVLLVEIGCVAALVWTGIEGVNWWIVAALCLVPVTVFFSLIGRVSRRWFHH